MRRRHLTENGYGNYFLTKILHISQLSQKKFCKKFVGNTLQIIKRGKCYMYT